MRTYKILLIIISVVFTFSLSSCVPNASNDEQKVYLSGEMLAKNIIEYYFIAADEITNSNNYQLELAGILSDTKPFIDEKTIIEDAGARIELFSEYIAVLEEMQKPAGIDKNPKQKIFSLLQTLESQNICSEDTIKLLRDYISANQFDINIAVFEATSIMYNVWQNDVLNWKDILNYSYETYAKMVDNIPSEVFDEEKLIKFVYEPYKGKQTLVNVYKLNMKQEAFEKKSEFLNETIFLMNIFLDLKTLYFQYSNQSTDKDYVELTNTNIYNTLVSFEKKNNQNNLVK